MNPGEGGAFCSHHFEGEHDLDGALGAVHPAYAAMPALLGMKYRCGLLFLMKDEKIAGTVPITSPATRTLLLIYDWGHGSTSGTLDQNKKQL
jgi:hypothetical protein